MYFNSILLVSKMQIIAKLLLCICLHLYHTDHRIARVHFSFPIIDIVDVQMLPLYFALCHFWISECLFFGFSYPFFHFPTFPHLIVHLAPARFFQVRFNCFYFNPQIQSKEPTPRMTLKTTAKAGWMPPWIMAAKQPMMMRYHSEAFSFMMRLSGGSGSFSSSCINNAPPI